MSKGLAAALIGFAIAAAPASAATITLGAPAPSAPGACLGCTGFQLNTAPSSPSYTVPPGDWTITSWTTRGSVFIGTAQLRVLRETATPGLYVIVAESSLETVPAGAAPTFATNIAVQPGDVLGLRTGHDVQLNYSADTGDSVGSVTGDPAVGQSVGPGGDASYTVSGPLRVNVGATLQSPDPPSPEPEPPADSAAPETTIAGGPAAKTKKKSATFAFSGSDARAVASFQCKLDSGSFEPCTSPKSYSGLKKGSHTFQVRAVDAAGNVDPTPATRTWKVKKKKKKK